MAEVPLVDVYMDFRIGSVGSMTHSARSHM